MVQLNELIDFSASPYSSIFESAHAPWEALKNIKPFFDAQTSYGVHTLATQGSIIGNLVTIGEGTVVEPGAVIMGPAIIGKNCLIRSGAYIREHVLIGDSCVIGHASEIKHSILLDGCQVAHFNYVGDSILGNGAHMAAGSIIANVKIMSGSVRVTDGTESIDTGLDKFGAVLGDLTDIGCNAVINPGSIIGRNCIIFPLVSWRGVLANNMIAKGPKECIVRK
ncbi:MAG: UDP-N-acetylglucosamine diphosphorylase [bacterium]|nr:UDP-N-acetylglucosamine diphosphorylase [bacterium]